MDRGLQRFWIDDAVYPLAEEGGAHGQLNKAFEREFSRIAEQVDQNLLQPLEVCIHAQRHVVSHIFENKDHFLLKVQLDAYQANHVENQLA